MEEMKNSSTGCPVHGELEGRVHRLEGDVSIIRDELRDIKDELKQRAISDGRITQAVEMVLETQKVMQGEVTGLRTDMLKLVTETLNKSRDDVSNFLKLQEKNEEKEREHKRQSEIREQDYLRRAQDGEKAFYRKLIIGCLSIGGTIVLAFFGLKAIAPGLF